MSVAGQMMGIHPGQGNPGDRTGRYLCLDLTDWGERPVHLLRIISAAHGYSVRRTRIGSTDAALRAGR